MTIPPEFAEIGQFLDPEGNVVELVCHDERVGG